MIYGKWTIPGSAPDWQRATPDRPYKATSFRLKPKWKLWWADSPVWWLLRRMKCFIIDHDYVDYSSSIRPTDCNCCGRLLHIRRKLY